jgi:hypothetical protein
MALQTEVQESRYIDATVLAVHADEEFLYLEGPEQEALRVIPCPPKYGNRLMKRRVDGRDGGF